jgi:hypothetical protein
MLSTLKMKRSQNENEEEKFVWELPDQTCRLNPKSLKKSYKNQIYQSERKFLQKHYVSHLKSVKESKIRIMATRRNLQAQPKMLKKLSIQPIRTKKKS